MTALETPTLLCIITANITCEFPKIINIYTDYLGASRIIQKN